MLLMEVFMENSLEKQNEMIMKLLHYFITEKNYNPIILQGAENEIWLENLASDYKIVRIVSNHIHNNEQLTFDIFKTKRVVKKIKKQTCSFNMNVLSIFMDLGENVHLENIKKKNLYFVNLEDEQDLGKYDFITKSFPDITKKLIMNEKGMQLYLKLTKDINVKNQKTNREVEDVFKEKNPIITRILIAFNIMIYLYMVLTGNGQSFMAKFAVFGPYIKFGQYYRLLTGAFIHANIFHLLFNCYALYIIGSQVESYLGKAKYTFIYLISAISSSLLSMLFAGGNYYSVGASGAIFGLMGALLYFGYYYRVYLGNVLKSQIIPLILINLIIGFVSPGIDNFGHIGGLIAGILSTYAVGVKYKTGIFEKTNGWILLIIYFAFLIYMAFSYAM